MTSRRMFVLVCVFACIVGASMAVAAVTLDDFERVLTLIPIASEARVIAALELGLKSSCCGFPADETYRLFTRLADGSGSAADKEAVILIVTHAIEEGIPIDSLLNKANEGLARAVSLPSLAQLLQQRLRLLEESRDLFYSRGIFRATPGAPVAAGATALSTSRFDGLLSNFGDALGDYLESGGSPFESQQIYDEMQARLTLLAGNVLSADDVELLLDRVGPADLTQVVLAALR
ncbi:MAG: hypothetical protein NTX23_00160 [Candidatus Bipolaricaulota bacterium]|nr:hypothetical protein [Candidatus Bipolaricaulota bacterium]